MTETQALDEDWPLTEEEEIEDTIWYYTDKKTEAAEYDLSDGFIQWWDDQLQEELREVGWSQDQCNEVLARPRRVRSPEELAWREERHNRFWYGDLGPTKGKLRSATQRRIKLLQLKAPQVLIDYEDELIRDLLAELNWFWDDYLKFVQEIS